MAKFVRGINCDVLYMCCGVAPVLEGVIKRHTHKKTDRFRPDDDCVVENHNGYHTHDNRTIVKSKKQKQVCGYVWQQEETGILILERKGR